MKNTVLLSLLLLCGCSTVGTKLTDTHPCTPNLTKTGNFFAGTTYKCFKEYASISKATAFDKIVSSMAMNGYQINSSNKDIGLIGGALPIFGGQGEVVPMNVMINDSDSRKIKVSCTISLPGGSVSGGGEITKYFCSVYEALEK